MKLKLLLLAILLSIGVAGYADGLVKVAILDIVDREGTVPYGQKLMLRSCLTTSVSLAPGYEGYDRVDMESIFGEQDFQRTGLVSSEQIHRLGKMTGASFVLVAEAAPFDAGNLAVSAKILDVETARITNSSENICPLIPPSEMREMCIEMARSLLGMFDTATPFGGNGRGNKNSFNVINVDFANVDSKNNIITGFGSTLFSHSLKFLCPKIKYSGQREGRILLREKIIEPGGGLFESRSSPSGYTWEHVCTVSKGTGEIRLSGFGSDKGGVYESGVYRYELWLDEENIYTTYFEVK